MRTPGVQLASGGTSDVFAFGTDSIIKVPRPGVPSHWAAMEAGFTEAIHAHGLPAPEVRGTEFVDGRESIVFQRLDGPAMWDRMLERPADVPALISEVAEIHRTILSAGIPAGLPDWVSRMESKIMEVDQLADADRVEAAAIVDGLPRGAALLHGDLHPMNIIMGGDGPVVIDWFDASIGHPVSDVLRSTWLMRPPTSDISHAHLPDSDEVNCAELASGYLDHFGLILEPIRSLRAPWEAVVAAGRLSEGLEGEEDELLEIWSRRSLEPG